MRFGARVLLLPLTAALALGGGACSPSRTLPAGALLTRGPERGFLDARALRAIAFARAQVGKRYCWGGQGPRCFDCSGLVQAAWSHAGARLPRTSRDMSTSLTEVPLDDVRPGDILWWPGHVGLYVGGGTMIDALNSRKGVVERPARDPFRAYRPAG